MGNAGRVMRRGYRFVVAALLLAGLAGCGGKDVRPKYVAPNLAESEAATLKADTDFWIDEVDGAVTKKPGVKIVVQPGNTVKVTPGEHSVRVSRSQSNTLVSPGGGSSFWRFNYNFRAGHTYKLGGAGFMAKGIKIKDTTTGTETVVGG
jgi:hypothetical protein